MSADSKTSYPSIVQIVGFCIKAGAGGVNTPILGPAFFVNGVISYLDIITGELVAAKLLEKEFIGKFPVT